MRNNTMETITGGAPSGAFQGSFWFYIVFIYIVIMVFLPVFDLGFVFPLLFRFRLGFLLSFTFTFRFRARFLPVYCVWISGATLSWNTRRFPFSSRSDIIVLIIGDSQDSHYYFNSIFFPCFGSFSGWCNFLDVSRHWRLLLLWVIMIHMKSLSFTRWSFEKIRSLSSSKKTWNF